MNTSDKRQINTHRETFQTALLVALVGVLLFSAFGLGAATTMYLTPRMRAARPAASPSAVATEEPTREEAAALLWQVWDILEAEYLDPDSLAQQKMIRSAAAGLVGALQDPYTVLVDPVPAAIMDEDMQGSFEGIGATVGMVEGQLTIREPLPGSPALAAGLQVGDVVLEVDGVPISGMDLLDAISLIRGPRGSMVRLVILRGAAEPFEVAVTRERVDLPIIEAAMLDGQVAYLALSEFNAVAERKLRSALQELLAEEPVGLILDLRNNPGGYFQVAIDVTSEFLPRGLTVVSEKQRDRDMTHYKVSLDGVALQVPLVVLINDRSASASEIVAGALQDHTRATIIGESSFGKGSVQNVHRLDDGSSLRVTIAKYYLPNGQNLDSQGIVPDIEVSYTVEDAESGRDPQLERAVEHLIGGG